MQATVAALSGLSRESRINASKPILISGTCKSESSDRHADLLQTLILACQNSAQLGGRLYSIGTDGCSMRGKALRKLVMTRHLPQSSRIYPVLGDIPLFNYQCGPDDITEDCDWKHVAKRFRNALIRESGTVVNGVLINRENLVRHLTDNGVDTISVNAWLDPSDKQDVVLMWKLFAAVAMLPEVGQHCSPTYAQTRRAIVLLGKVYRAFLETYTAVNLSLREQLKRLSFISHMLLIIYRAERSKFIPSQLYNDCQKMVKNVYFNTAKLQVDAPDGEHVLIQNGTDDLKIHLETLAVTQMSTYYK